MPITTRSQARSKHSLELVSSSRAHPPRQLNESRQASTHVSRSVVTRETEDGTPSSELANGNFSTNSFTVSPCGASRCKTCSMLVNSYEYSSNVTNRTYKVLNHSKENLSCKSQNIIYLLACKNCNMQYVGETTIPLNKRMNIHRTSKTGCTHVIEHFTNICSHSDMSIQIIEKFDGNGYNASNEIDENMLRIRKDREDTIMKTLRVIYPYGLNEQSKNKNYDGCHVGSLFPPLPRNGDRSKHTHNNRKSESQISLKKFFDDFK